VVNDRGTKQRALDLTQSTRGVERIEDGLKIRGEE